MSYPAKEEDIAKETRRAKDKGSSKTTGQVNYVSHWTPVFPPSVQRPNRILQDPTDELTTLQVKATTKNVPGTCTLWFPILRRWVLGRRGNGRSVARRRNMVRGVESV